MAAYNVLECVHFTVYAICNVICKRRVLCTAFAFLFILLSSFGKERLVNGQLEKKRLLLFKHQVSNMVLCIYITDYIILCKNQND